QRAWLAVVRREEVEDARRAERRLADGVLEPRDAVLARRRPRLERAQHLDEADHRLLEVPEGRAARRRQRTGLGVEQDGPDGGVEIAADAAAVVGEHAGDARDVARARVARDQALNELARDER